MLGWLCSLFLGGHLTHFGCEWNFFVFCHCKTQCFYHEKDAFYLRQITEWVSNNIFKFMLYLKLVSVKIFWCKLHFVIRFDIYLKHLLSMEVISEAAMISSNNSGYSIIILDIQNLFSKFNCNSEHIFLLIWGVALAWQSKMLMQYFSVC